MVCEEGKLLVYQALAEPDSSKSPVPGRIAVTAMRQLSDHALALALLAGHPAAPREAVRRFSPLVRRLLRRFFGQQTEVEDALQEVFLRIFSRLQTLREPQAFRAFVIAITVRTAGRHAQRARSWHRLVTAAAEVAANHHGALDVTAPSALRRLNGVLARVCEPERTAFVLRFIERRGLEEIAELSGTSHSTVRRRLVRAWARVSYLASKDIFLTDYLRGTRIEQQHGSSEPAPLS